MTNSKLQSFTTLIAITIAACVSIQAAHVQADDFVVNTLSDDTDGGNDLLSLREAIEAANTLPGTDEVVFDDDLSGQITLTEGEILITDGVEILGPGAHVLTVSGNDSSRIFRIVADTTVLIAGLTISDGLADLDAADLPCAGGAILNRGDLTLWQVAVVDNSAVGDPDTDIVITFELNFGGGAIGGGVVSLSQLTVFGSEFHNNQALGADGAVRAIGNFPGGPAFVSDAFGGALYCLGDSSVSHCHFTDNLVRAGSDGVGDFFGSVVGGAIYNERNMNLSHCHFEGNCAEAGDRGLSFFHNGHSLGGALGTGSVAPLVDPNDAGASITISHCSFHDNHSLGGDENVTVAAPEDVPRADGPNNGYGGAILAFQGAINISHVAVTENSAEAGAGGPEGGAEYNGGLGVGGGIFLFGFISQVDAQLQHVMLRDNRAVGGVGLNGAPGGSGIGGGLTVGTLSSPFAAVATANISRSLIFNNEAVGGSADEGATAGNGDGGGIASVAGAAAVFSNNQFKFNRAIGGSGNGDGGDGRGGGIHNETDADLSLVRNLIFFNSAIGGTDDAADGTGFGGGIYNTGIPEIDFFTLMMTRFNTADEGSNFFGL